MSIITERLNANKPPQSVPDPKSGKLAPGVINNNKDLDVDLKKDEQSFFGSFFAKPAAGKKKTTMEAVGTVLIHGFACVTHCFCSPRLSFALKPR